MRATLSYLYDIYHVTFFSLINIIKPGSVKKINNSKMAFKQMENIGKFLDACEGIGMVKTDLFQTVDLFEVQNIPLVVDTIHALGRKVSEGLCHHDHTFTFIIMRPL